MGYISEQKCLKRNKTDYEIAHYSKILAIRNVQIKTVLKFHSVKCFLIKFNYVMFAFLLHTITQLCISCSLSNSWPLIP